MALYCHTDHNLCYSGGSDNFCRLSTLSANQIRSFLITSCLLAMCVPSLHALQSCWSRGVVDPPSLL